ncbi:glutamine--tRNA ligase/YqeY domain fusion protein [Planctomycetales bacterium ZRK34]|nr:glutamine--tRNA ligase/YqeY domain fusion protein [Planctomycetales bacterium ZRK34]
MSTETASRHFIRDIVDEHNRTGRFGGKVITRFPPEPNGFLHIGHAKSICLNFGLAADYGGVCHLRMDDTNPTKEEQKYIDAIHTDVKWLGFDWGPHEYYASDYFEQLYEWAITLIEKGLAYVDDQNAEQIRQTRGTLTRPGTESPYRNRSVEENLGLFQRMRAGEFGNGEKVLRAKIDMASPNVNLRDPVMYRILHAPHPHTGDKWCIYPMYDYAHGQSDSIEGITHSICTLEFEDHRPLYDWFCDALEIHHPQQIEFARLNLTYTVMSKRKLLTLVKDNHVADWSDPRMPTISGMRRRGYTPAALRNFCARIGMTKFNSTTEFALLEHCVREDLNKVASRRMAVLDPLRVVITNYPEDQTETMSAVNNPEDESAGRREVPFSKVVYIERDDFMEDPPRKFFRLAPGKEVRLRYAYWITCTDVIKDDAGNIVELHATYDPATRGGESPPPDSAGNVRKVKGTIHWVSAEHALDAEVRLYDHLFTKENPDEVEEGQDFTAHLNPDSLKIVTGAKLEPSLADFEPGDPIQFERIGYFTPDIDSTKDTPIFNRSITLKDTWAKMQKKQ